MTARPPTAWRRASSLSVAEAGRVIGVGRSHAYQLADQGKLPYYRTPTGRRRVRPADLEPLVLDGGDPDLFGAG